MEGIVQSAQWKVGAQADAPGKAMARHRSDDQELLRQLAKGNEAAFRTLYERHQGAIYRFALHMTGNSASAEEITQEVFMLLIRNPKNYDARKGELAGYLYGIARNLARRGTQQTQFNVPLDEEGAGQDEFALAGDLDVLEELSQAELIDCLRKAVLALPGQYREVVVLCDLEEMSYEQAGEVLGCAPGTVASRLHRARAMLKTKLSAQKCVR
jgi:RNA polymerase sigma-70 factor, ECF subfamily